jgi:DnaJ-like protein
MEREPHEVLGVARSAPWQDVRAAYRTLARRYHPDGTAPDARRMAAANEAYEALEHARRASTGEKQPLVPMGPGAPAHVRPPVQSRPAAGSLLGRIQAAQRIDTPVLDFGTYAGLRIAEVAERDPRYLLWLSRHSSGVRFRRAIALVLGPNPDVGRGAAVLS